MTQKAHEDDAQSVKKKLKLSPTVLSAIKIKREGQEALRFFVKNHLHL